MFRFVFMILLMTVCCSTMAFAMPKDKSGGSCVSCHTLSVKEASDIVGKLAGDGKVTEVKHSPVPGLFEVHLEVNGQKGIAHIDYSKKYLVPGLVFEVATGKPTVAPPPPAPPAKTDFSNIPQEHSVVLGNPNGTKRLVVFTDPDCPYCQKFHEELKKLVTMDNQIAILVKLFPLKMHPQAYDKSRAILSARNPQELLDKAFSGAAIPTPEGDTGRAAVDETLKFAAGIGVNSTPTLVLSDGTIVVGGKDAAALAKMLR